jgi:hypothetical protein
MKTSISFKHTIVTLVLLAVVFITAGCGDSKPGSGRQLGVEIPSDQPVVSLATLLEDPASFDGKRIVMRGVLSGQCASLCEFFMLDGKETATVYPQGFDMIRLEKNTSVTIYAEITNGEENVVISALGLRAD